MKEDRDASTIAECLVRQLGREGLSLVSGRIEICRQKGDEQGAALWRDVARAMEDIVGAEPGSLAGAAYPPVEPSSRLWRAMQHIELCRHRAQEFDNRASTGSEAFRQEMRELAQKWRELAAQAEQLALAAQLH